jgi:predicted ATPase
MSLAQGLKLGLSGSAEAQVFAYLRDKIMLLVLDNCEQVVEGIAWLSNLLANAPGIKVLATSRERLQLSEEWIYSVPMMAESQAIELFDQTAQRLNPHFAADEERAAISIICQLVENLPLAIELAASWTPFLSCEQIAQNIQQDIDFLTANVRNVPERHHSIRAVFDHSWRLLTPAEQDVMMRLSVFRGGWTVDEAQPIAGATLITLRALIEKSLVRVAGRGRYDLHELVRQYAADKLTASGSEAEMRQHHAQVYLALAGKFDIEILGPNGIAAFARLDQESDNFRAGISWALEVGEVDIARQYIDSLFMYWQRRGHWLEGERWARAAAPRAGEQDSRLLCWNLLSTSVFIAMQGRYSEASSHKASAMEMAFRLEDPETMMRFFFVEGQGVPSIEAAEKIWHEFFSIGGRLEVYSKHIGKEAVFAAAHFLFGDRLRDVGRGQEAASHYRQSLNLYRQIGNVDMIAYPIGNLGRLALREGRVDEAYDALVESVTISRASGNRLGIADWQQQLGNACLIKGDLSQAESCFEESLALYQEMGAMRSCPDVLADLGYTAYLKGALPQARHYLHDSLRVYLRNIEILEQSGMGWDAYILPPEFLLCYQTIALLDIEDSEFERPLILLSATAVHQAKFGSGADLGIQARVDEALAALKSQLSAETFDQKWSSAYSMRLDQVFTYLSEMLRNG